jgi:hypothetical protein
MSQFTNKAVFAFAWAVILCGILSIGTVVYWTLAPYDGLVDVVTPNTVAHKVIEQGQLQTYTLSYCVDQALPLPLTMHRSIEIQGDAKDLPGGSLAIAPPVVYEITERCETRKFSIGLGLFVPPGTYHIHTETALQVNPLREVHQAWVSEEFEVVACIRCPSIK